MLRNTEEIMSFKYHIQALVDSCNDLSSKLDLLTTIAICTDNQEVFRDSEEIRNNLPEGETVGIDEIRAEIIRNPVEGSDSDYMLGEEGSYESIESEEIE
jgi:hypothetical protein